MALLEIQDIHVSFDQTEVLHGVSFEVEAGNIACLLGPSGCGKTTLMRVVAGLQPADQGQVFFEDRNIDDVAVHQRGFGLMFQEFALFPHKDVYENVVFGLRMANWGAAQTQTRVREVLDLVGLAGFEERDVTELSGGERQRVALARSLAPSPRLLMLDEPLGSLDRILRDRLMVELRRILKDVGLTSLYVTHDQEEAFAVADRVLIMQAGNIVQRGTPEEAYRRPATPFVARFLGLTNLLSGEVVGTDPASVETPLGRLQVDSSGAGAGERVTVLARPEAAYVVAPGSYADNIIEGTLTDRSFRGSHYQIEVQPAGGPTLTFELDASSDMPDHGATVRLALRRDALTILSNRDQD
ncbi:MAG: Spermidine/putrescine import ATP-binding protein PotA [Anaerolineales bacterium]|nr:Spermidine/putrescine import ATP-binding protein PotA [Anaerolineales bacterium]